MPLDSLEFLKNHLYSAHSRIHNYDFLLLPVFSVSELPYHHENLLNANNILFSVHGDSGKKKCIQEQLLPQRQNIQTESMFLWLLGYTSNYAFSHNFE